MRNIDNDPVAIVSEGRRLTRIVDKIVGRQNMDGIAVAVDRLDQVVPLRAELERRRDAAPADNKPFDKVVSIHSLLPKQQEQKLFRWGIDAFGWFALAKLWFWRQIDHG